MKETGQALVYLPGDVVRFTNDVTAAKVLSQADTKTLVRLQNDNGQPLMAEGKIRRE